MVHEAGRLSLSTKIVLAALGVTLLALVGGGTWFYRAEQVAMQQQAEMQLLTIARGKVAQIAHWRDEQLDAARELTQSPFFAEGVQRFLSNARSVEAAEPLRQRLEATVARNHYADALLVDSLGHVLLTARGIVRTGDAYATELSQLRSSSEPLLLDLHQDHHYQSPHMTVIAPIRGHGSAQSPLGFALLVIDASHFLYPLVESWPTLSSTAETLLVRRDGDQVLFLNNLRHLSNTALNLRVPLTQTEVPAVAGAVGHTGLFEGRDYRGVEVVAAILPVANSSWIMVAKQDRSEVFAAWRARSTWLLALMTSLFLGLGAVAVFAQERDRRVHAQRLLRAENELHSLEQRDGIILGAIGDGIITANPEGLISGCNQSAASLLGWAAQQLNGQSIEQVLHLATEASLERIQSPVAAVLCDSPVAQLAGDTVLIAKDGTIRPVACSVGPVRDHHGAMVAVVVVLRDQTNERRTQRLLQMRLALVEYSRNHSVPDLLRRVLDELGAMVQSPIGFYHFVNADENTLALTQWSSRTLAEFCKAEGGGTHYPVSMAGVWADALRTRKPVVHNDYASLPNRRGLPPGHAEVKRELVVPVLRDGRVMAVLGVGNKSTDYTEKDVETVTYFADVTWQLVAQRRSEESQHESALRFRAIYDHAPAGIIQVTLNLKVQHANPTFCRMVDCDEAELLGKFLGDLARSELAPDLMRIQAQLAQGELERYEQELCFLRSNRTELQCLVSVSLVRDPSTEASYALMTVTDITERKQVEAERERLLAAIEQTADAIIITDPHEVIQYVNPAFEVLTGYRREEALGKTPRILRSGKHDAAFYQSMWKTLLSGRTLQQRLVNKYEDGSLHFEDVTISSVRDASGQVVNYVSVQRDVTETMKLAEQMQQAQKMESVGRLAGGVAHDFNNMLGVILGHTELALVQVAPSGPIYEDLIDIRKAAERSAELTRQLLTFARRQTVAPRVLVLDDAIEGILKMLRRLIGEDIELAWSPGAAGWRVKLDPVQLDQILANLCVNARDAIGGGGKITIETGTAKFDAEYCSRNVGFVPGEFVSLAVHDNGCGMDPETLTRLFEPFFTTKELGHGTGLGLATVYGIVRQNSGLIDVASEPAKGSVFRLYFPRSEEAESTGHVAPPPWQQRGQGETVLLVEDEVSILSLVRSMLERLGYQVLVANEPTTAIAVAESHPGELHLLLTDVVMSGMNGRDLAAQIVLSRPSIKSLFMSGYPADVIAHHGVLDEGVTFVHKPFTLGQLARKVRLALDSAVKPISKLAEQAATNGPETAPAVPSLRADALDSDKNHTTARASAEAQAR